MTKMLSRILPGTVLSAILLASAVVWSMPPHDGPRGGPPGGEEMIGRLTEELDISDVQKEQIDKLVATAREKASADHARMREIRDELKGMLKQFDDAAAQKLTRELGDISARMAYRMTSTGAQIYAVLTPEQQAQLDARMQEMEKRMEQRKAPPTR